MTRKQSAGRQLGAVRRQQILDLLHTSGYLRSTEVSKAFGISDETARRDLAVLDGQGRLRRVRGGAVPADSISESEPTRGQREIAHIAEKREIAAVLHGLIPDGSTLFFDVGTTVEMAARALVHDFRGRVITTSLQVGMILGESSRIELEMIGGRVRHNEFTVHGSDALQALGNYSADLAIIGCGGLTLAQGVTDFTPGDIPLKQAMINRAVKSFVLADSSKIGRIAVRLVCPLSSNIDVITDSKAEDAAIEELRRSDATILQA